MNKYWLTPNEVNELTGKQQRSAQLRVLQELGYTVRMRPDGSFIVPTDQFQPESTDKPKREYKHNFEALRSVS